MVIKIWGKVLNFWSFCIKKVKKHILHLTCQFIQIKCHKTHEICVCI